MSKRSDSPFIGADNFYWVPRPVEFMFLQLVLSISQSTPQPFTQKTKGYTLFFINDSKLREARKRGYALSFGLQAVSMRQLHDFTFTI